MKLKIIIVLSILLIVIFFYIKKPKNRSMKNCTAKYSFSKSSLRRLKGVDSLLVEIMEEAVKCSPYDFGIAWMGGLRTAAEQNSLYKKNTSKKWITSKDGYIKKSRHQFGEAVDIIVYNHNRITWQSYIFKRVAAHILKVAKDKFNVTLIWGGNWNRKDYGHFQIKK